MSDPITDLNPSSPENAREIGAALVRSGQMTVEQATSIWQRAARRRYRRIAWNLRKLSEPAS